MSYEDDYLYSRAAARSALFSYQQSILPFGLRRRFERAWKLLTTSERATLRDHGTRSVTDWDQEAAAVDRLRDLLRQVDADRRARRRVMRAAA